jgi:hypothetical protein
MDDALSTLEEAVQANPEESIVRPPTLICGGDLQRKIGQSEMAEADFREAISLGQR